MVDFETFGDNLADYLVFKAFLDRLWPKPDPESEICIQSYTHNTAYRSRCRRSSAAATTKSLSNLLWVLNEIYL
jgi:hypothetical protein